MSYKLTNAEERAAASPDTFEIPARDERRALSPGAVVKLVFLTDSPHAPGERMWVSVTAVTEKFDVVYEGRLVNTPVCNVGATFGDRIVFGPEHVIAIQAD